MLLYPLITSYSGKCPSISGSAPIFKLWGLEQFRPPPRLYTGRGYVFSSAWIQNLWIKNFRTPLLSPRLSTSRWRHIRESVCTLIPRSAPCSLQLIFWYSPLSYVSVPTYFILHAKRPVRLRRNLYNWAL